MTPIEDKNLEIALKEYELATQHYFHEDKMKTDALKNSILAVIALMTAVATIISAEYLKDYPIIKFGFSVIMGLSGILISVSYGVQYRRILKYQKSREDRLEKLEKIIEERNHFEIRTIRDGLEQMKSKESPLPKNKFLQSIDTSLETVSSSIYFRFLVPWFLIILWFIFLVVVVIGLLFYSF